MSKETILQRVRNMPRNIWAVSLTSFFMDISSEMVINILPFYLFNVIGVRTPMIGLIEGVAESTASILKVFSGWISDKLRGRKWVAVLGYGISALSKPFFYIANSWGWVAGVRWTDRLGKGIRTAPRDALVADSIKESQRGIAFGLHRAADTGGAVIGLLIAALVVWRGSSVNQNLAANTFQKVVLISLIPAFLAVLSLALGARETFQKKGTATPKLNLKNLGRPFLIFLIIVGVFDLGNSSDAFLILRAQERGMGIIGILLMLASFNLVYALVSTPAGDLSDHIGRRRVIIGGWLFYGLIYLGFALVQKSWQVWGLFIAYGLYYGLAYGTAKAMVADLVRPEMRGTAYGTYNAILGIIDLPASLVAGVLWQGIGGWEGFGPAAPFLFGSILAFLAAGLLWFWKPTKITAE